MSKLAARALKDCPFCGSENGSLKITGPIEMDERRFYRLSLECEGCDCIMNYDLAFHSYQDLKTPKAVDYMMTELFKKWNRRSGYKITLEVT
jgi:hypothetical protein